MIPISIIVNSSNQDLLGKCLGSLAGQAAGDGLSLYLLIYEPELETRLEEIISPWKKDFKITVLTERNLGFG